MLSHEPESAGAEQPFDLEEWNARIDRLVTEHRTVCLWFLREDYLPATLEERMRVLQYIQQHGNRAAFRQAGELRECLSRLSSENSAG
ncbi:MAG: hypothetical protein FJX77_13285 [Armatimonadetes bacterium]|nr:hypothetical protein [Armatimonadota bacterium]